MITIKKLKEGLVVLNDDKPVLVQKGNVFGIPDTAIKIYSIGDIPLKEMVKIALNKKQDIPILVNKLGIDYYFKYTLVSGIKTESIKLGERNMMGFGK